ncbi:Putrescine transport ATP-binding protein PotG (TC 3.A.1.11.2) [Patulibacter medicamentivorans]|uniref:Spermidine/putrescine import ATP-binding protein PotA n=1 Tax=Patulibacter medicamentivorans TaxID=1097667 RepID=H0E5Z4_9ACTN|nr:ABC transporter ATP-binding protein [Patulibacter medicamentivorans]EHN10888.1 Putrescine transport ATP-binding protein PotG (TC 3.A.1.11.2) [Patulibacter medicamentivorans]
MTASETAARSTSGSTEAGGDIRLERVSKRYGDQVVIDDLSLQIDAGAFYALLGPSGCGKTTTLRMIGGFELPSAGRIFLGGQEVSGLPPHKRKVNTVFQSYALFPHLTIAKNVAFGLERAKVPKHEIRTRVAEALETVQLSHLAERKPAQISGGQAQRVALARALVNRPRALLLDEPLGALDLRLRRQLQIELKKIQADVGITFIHVTHDQEEAMSMADTIAVMSGGRIEQAGSATDLYERPETSFVANFLGKSNLIDVTLGPVDGEFNRVTTHDGAEVLLLQHRIGDLAGGPVRIGIRPEKLYVVPAGEDPPPGSNVLRGRVLVSSFLGVTVEYLVRTEGGDEVTVICQNDTGDLEANLGAGHPVTLSWDPRHTFVVEGEARG